MMPGYRQPRPYGPPPFFGPEIDDPFAPQGQAPAPQPAVNPWLPGVGAGPGVGYDAGAGVEQSTIAPEPQGSFEEWSPSQGQAPTGAQPPAGGQMPEGDYPSEADIERRLRLAKALMGQQQEVNHPLQAIGNAVNQIAGAYLENKAAKDREGIENRRRDAFKKAFGGGGGTDLEALADELLKSNDPALVDKGLEIKLALATQERQVRKPPTVRDFPIGDQQVPHEWNEETGQWEPIEGMGGPRWRAGGGGGDGGDGAGGDQMQKNNQVILPGETRPRFARWNKSRGEYEYKTDDGKWAPVPNGTVEVTPSVSAPVSKSDMAKLDDEIIDLQDSIAYFDNYSKTRGGAPQGLRFAVGEIIANAKTMFGGELTPEQLAILRSKGEFSTVLGLFRTAVLGPGVMTQADREFLEEALGQYPNAFQNKEVMQQIVDMWIQRRRHRLKQLLTRRAQWSGTETSAGMTAPEGPSTEPSTQGAPGSQVPKPQFKDGDTKTIIDREGKFGPKGARVTFKRVSGNWTIVR